MDINNSNSRENTFPITPRMDVPEGPIGISLFNYLSGVPQHIRLSPVAMLALSLADMIDKGVRAPECSRELRQCLNELEVMHKGGWTQSTMDELKNKREERRSS